MTVLPIIGRELRAAARQSFSYHLRVLGVAAMLLAAILFGMDNGLRTDRGDELFASLHFTLFIAIWVLVPFLAADCISRERREGTLGLLFLTHLKPSGVVMAKGVVHGLRAMTLWIAVLPVVAIPILMGGVSWTQVVLSVLINFSALLCALAAGLLASAYSKTWLSALVRAACLASLLFLLMSFMGGNFLAPIFTRRSFLIGYTNFLFSIVSGVGFVTNSMGIWPAYLRLTPGGSQMILAMVKLAIFSASMLAFAVALAGRRIKSIWQEEPPSARQVWLETAFCTPIFAVGFLHRWMRWKLDHNPVGWLEQRTWSGRLVTWGWLAVVVSLYSVALTDSAFFHNYSGMQKAAAWFLALTIASSSAGSFQRERESGVLELLLVSPVGEDAIIFGRLRGLWGQFLPTVLLLLGVWTYFSTIFGRFDDMAAIFFHAMTFLTLPVVGLYFSLRCRNFIYAFLATLVVGLLVPLLLPPIIGLLFWLFTDTDSYYEWGIHLSAWAGLCQFGLATIFMPLLHARLRKRTFVLGSHEASH